MKMPSHLIFDEEALMDLSRGGFVDDPHNIIIYSESEDAAGHAAQILCEKMKQNGFEASYIRARHLIGLLNEKGKRKVCRQFDAYDLVCIDKITLASLTYLDIHRIFEVLADRLVVGTVLLPTGYTLSELGKLFDLFQARSTFEALTYRAIIAECPAPLHLTGSFEPLPLSPWEYRL